MQGRLHTLYLGHVISDRGIETDPEKVKCVVDWPVPMNQKQLQRFMCRASYYRRFVRSFAQIAASLHALTQKGREWEWTQVCNEALKKRLLSTPILSLPNFNLGFIVNTYASGEGLGAMIPQVIDGHECVVSYAPLQE